MARMTTLYDASTIGTFAPDACSETGQAALSIAPMIRDGAGHYIDNVSTDFQLLELDELALPVTVSHSEPGNAYVCSPYCHYATYAKEELRHLPSPILRAPLAGMLKLLAAVLRWSDIDRTVYVNNWLVSTNLHPDLTKAQLAEITEYVIGQFPEHAIALRSANTRGNRQLMKDADVLGYKKIASRRVYYQDTRSDAPFRSKSYRRDASLFAKSGYEATRVTSSEEVDLDRLVELYRLLYIEKYSRYNPQFNSRFVRMAIDRGLLHFYVLEKKGHIDAVAGFFIRGEVITTPFFGYDTRLPQETGLYRMVSMLLLHEARERRLLLHASSGAAGFKRARGGVAATEYTLVHSRHLSFRRRCGWQFVATLANHVGLPLMKRFRL